MSDLAFARDSSLRHGKRGFAQNDETETARSGFYMVEKDTLKEMMKKRNGQLATLLESVNGNGNGIYDKMKEEKGKNGKK